MGYRVLANLVVLVHAAFVLLVLLGGLLAFRWRRAPLLHIPAALWGGWIEISGGVCPLTPLENWLMELSGSPGYAGGFIEHYLLPVLYPPGLTRTVQSALAAVVVVVNVLVYSWVWRDGRRRP
jgi:Protein of Unknown function (DUF2784)